MHKSSAYSGEVHYTGRAFRMDASEAMGRDIVRGLIEMITNSDDSYALSASSGKIWIGAEHTRGTATWDLTVRDRAGGMTSAEMMRGLTSIGERTSGFETGAAVRGNRGRGAKDLIAFGDTEFESIKDGRYSKLALRRDGHYTATPERKAENEDRERLHIPRGSGTQVTVHVQRSFRCPRHERLADQIRRDFQLRDIMADPRREVLLAKTNDPESATERLRYEVDWQALDPLLDEEIAIEGYPDARARVRAWRLPERCDSPPSDRTRPSGLLVCGRRAIYDNTLFRFEALPYAGWVAGRIDCPYIDQLALEYDDRDERSERHADSNPIQVISRRRQGLAPEHPFARKLATAIEALLEPVMDELDEAERARSRELESAETRSELDRLGKEAARLMQESMRELEQEEDPGGRSGILEDIKLVPTRLNVPLDEVRTLSVICARTGLEEGAEVVLTAEPRGVIEFTEGEVVQLGPHRDRADGLSARIRLRALRVDECLVEASVDGRSGLAEVHGVEPIQEIVVVPPLSLEFERQRLRIGVGKRRTVEIRAPQKLVDEHGPGIVLRSSHEGIVLRRTHVELVYDPALGFYAAGVRIEGRALGATGKVDARVGAVSAELGVRVVERDDGLPELRIEFSDEEPGSYRAYFDPPDPSPDGGQVLKILIRHPAIRAVLGDDLVGEASREWKVELAEVVADAIVRRLLTRRYPVTQEIDAQSLYREHTDWMTRILPRVQRVLLATHGTRRTPAMAVR